MRVQNQPSFNSFLPKVDDRSVKDPLKAAQEPKAAPQDLFDLDLEVKTIDSIQLPGPSDGAACSSTCISCHRTCGQCLSEQVRC